MTNRINKYPLTHDPELEALIKQAKKITMTAEQERAQSRSWVIGQMLLSNPHLTRDYVTGLVDATMAKTTPHEIAKTIADGILSKKRGRNARSRALEWAASVALSLYPAPEIKTEAGNEGKRSQ